MSPLHETVVSRICGELIRPSLAAPFRAQTAVRCSNEERVFRLTAALHVALTRCTPPCVTSCAALEHLGSLKGAGIRSWTIFADRQTPRIARCLRLRAGACCDLRARAA
ncbi:conserved hypothetical protein [Xanthomonas citri pv. fuscans]|nr:conserved hypothetical protein [Xanthomonas citri pv. fuscans]SON99672.1 conserved hypothetical protein [Xanthomonas citri pv. fuscans]SOO01881.1 conserved hypothetical protein [Xanthomonas citri pv. fuscans]SOO15886.1 conserved hypothetical protein [Xanthomonas citri pv. fuscans]SOO42600.1 conserved hypothetical protein [Xanthomonas citri pv. fuscans]